MKIYTLTWIQNGFFEYFNLKYYSSCEAIETFVNSGINGFPENCSCHSLFCSHSGSSRLVARQATYQGV